MVSLIQIESWLSENLDKPEIHSHLKSDTFLELINKDSRYFLETYLEKANKNLEYAFEDVFDCIKGADHSRYEIKTVWGYYNSFEYSRELINADEDNLIINLLYEWKHDLESIMNDDSSIHFNRLVRYNLTGGIPESVYLKSKQSVYNSLVNIIDACISDEKIKINPTSENFISDIVKEDFEQLNRLDKVIGLSNIYGKNDTIYWPHFWRAKFILEKINNDLNKRSGGPKPKIIKHLSNGYKEFCKDLNHHIENSACTDGDLIKTWDLAGLILKSGKYHFLNDQDGLNKFIKSVFDNVWLDFETDLELREIVKFKSNYYVILPNN